MDYGLQLGAHVVWLQADFLCSLRLRGWVLQLVGCGMQQIIGWGLGIVDSRWGVWCMGTLYGLVDCGFWPCAQPLWNGAAGWGLGNVDYSFRGVGVRAWTCVVHAPRTSAGSTRWRVVGCPFDLVRPPLAVCPWGQQLWPHAPHPTWSGIVCCPAVGSSAAHLDPPGRCVPHADCPPEPMIES